MVPRAQVKLGVPVHVPWEGVIVPRAKPDGQVSARVTPWASDGPPALLTVIVYVRVTPSPAVTLVTPSSFVTDRFALVATVSESVALLLPVFPSSVVVVTDAVFTCGVAVVEEGTV